MPNRVLQLERNITQRVILCISICSIKTVEKTVNKKEGKEKPESRVLRPALYAFSGSKRKKDKQNMRQSEINMKEMNKMNK